MKAAIYARFSSDKQSDRSIEDQIALCRALCAREGLTIAGLFEDRAIIGGILLMVGRSAKRTQKDTGRSLDAHQFPREAARRVFRGT
jgi:hypothetical protein